MIKLSDIAKELDISISLVSKVLNGRLGTTGARQDLVDTIHQTAQRMGYRKNLNAQSLATHRQNAIAVVMHRSGTAGSGVTERLLDGIVAETKKHSLRIDLQFFESSEEFRKNAIGIHSGAVDGMILSGIRHADLSEDLLQLQREGLPVVTIYNEPVHSNVVNIGIPDVAITEASTGHLFERGCQRVAHLAAGTLRTQGYRNALCRAGVPYRAELLVELFGPDSYSVVSGRNAIKKLLEAGVAFDGVCCQSDTQAVGVLNELLAQGVRVPQDVKIIGVDNAPFTEYCAVPLSSASQRIIDCGQTAVKLIGQMVEGETVESVLLEARICERASTQNI